MPDPSAATYVLEGRLRLSRAPVAELAAAALDARKRAGLDEAGADFIVVAVPSGTSPRITEAVAEAARAA